MVEEGEEVVVAGSSSTIFSCINGRSPTKLSSIPARISVAARRRFSCVFRSASSLADVAPTPKTIPAVAGGTIRVSISVIRSLSLMVHCFNNGSQSFSTSDTGLEKNLGSRKASPRSFFHAFWLLANLLSW